MKNKYSIILLLSLLLAGSSSAQNYIVDSSFGVNGKFRKTVSGDFVAINNAVNQADGKTLVCGCWWNGSTCDSGVIFRLKTDGTPDTTFGTNGYVSKYLGGINSSCMDLAVLSTGKIAILAFVQIGGLETANFLMYSSTGVLDNTFGTSGMVSYNPPGRNAEMFFMNKQSNDKLLMGGLTFPPASSNYQAELLRYNTNGTLDDTFATSGIFTVATSPSIASQDNIIVDAHDSIYFPLVDLSSAPSYYTLNEAKLTPDGSLVSGYGNGGYSDTVHDHGYMIKPVLMANGKLIFGTSNGLLPTLNINTYRFGTNGHKDAGYGLNGFKSFSFTGFDQSSNSYTFENNNKVIFAFDQASTTITGTRDLVMIQADSSGNQDMSFGTGGALRTNIGSAIVSGNAYKQTNGKIIVTCQDNTSAGVVVRYKHMSGTSVSKIVPGKLEVNAYPNPTSQTMILEAPQGTYYSIYDANGKVLLSGLIDQTKTSVNISNLAHGIYYLDCSKDDQMKVLKIEKQ